MFAAFSTRSVLNGENLFQQCPSLLEEPKTLHEILNYERSDLQDVGAIVWVVPFTAPPAPTSSDVRSPMAAFIIRSRTTEGEWIGTKVWDQYKKDSSAGTGAAFNRKRCPMIQPSAVVRNDWAVDLPDSIRIPRNDSTYLFVSNGSNILSIIAEDNTSEVASDIRSVVTSIKGLSYFSRDFDQTKLRKSLGTVGVTGGLTAPVYILKSQSQVDRDASLGLKTKDPDEKALDAQFANVSFLARIFGYNYFHLKRLLGENMDFKSIFLAATIKNLFAPFREYAGLLALNSHCLIHLLNGNFVSTMLPHGANSAIDGNYDGVGLQCFKACVAAHPRDPQAGQKKFTVVEFKTLEELRDAVAKFFGVYSILLTGSLRPTTNTLLQDLSRRFLDQIYCMDANQASRSSTVAKMYEFVVLRLAAWVSLTKVHYDCASERLEAPEYFEASQAALELLDSDILGGNNVKTSALGQFNNMYSPPAEKEKPVQEKKPNPNPNNNAANKKPKVDNPAGGGAKPKDPKNLPVSEQLCLNRFASLVGAGADCDKKPGMKGYPCTRKHVTAPVGSAKWPSAILDAAVIAANRVNILPLTPDVLAAIVLLR
jgi:hypothetical protein